jgi:hypothetical protein
MKTKNKSKSEKSKGIIGITLAAIMIASIFAIVAPTTVAKWVPPDPPMPPDPPWGGNYSSIRIYGDVQPQGNAPEFYDNYTQVFDPTVIPKDSFTCNPGFLNETPWNVQVNGQNAREKIFLRAWYEPCGRYNGSRKNHTYPTINLEYTYMLLNTSEFATSGGDAGNTKFWFPTKKKAGQSGLSEWELITLANVTPADVSDYDKTMNGTIKIEKIKTLSTAEEIEFLDHKLQYVGETAANEGVVKVWYVGNDKEDTPKGFVRLPVGTPYYFDRHNNMAITSNHPDRTWYITYKDGNKFIVGKELSRNDTFYVNGVRYDVTAVEVLDTTSNGETDSFTFITIRTKLPKGHADVQDESVVSTQRIQEFAPAEIIAVLPPFNKNYTMVDDIDIPLKKYYPGTEREWTQHPWTNHTTESVENRTICDVAPLNMTYIAETVEKRYSTDLLEKLNEVEGSKNPVYENWTKFDVQTLPDQYTEFVLPPRPDIKVAEDLGLYGDYLITTSLIAPQATGNLNDSKNGGNPLEQRVAFSYDPVKGEDSKDIYVNNYTNNVNTVRIYGADRSNLYDTYDDWEQPFNPTVIRKDSITFDTAILRFSTEYSMTAQNENCDLKTYLRVWYDHGYPFCAGCPTIDQEPAVVTETTYMLIDSQDKKPFHGEAKDTYFAFPIVSDQSTAQIGLDSFENPGITEMNTSVVNLVRLVNVTNITALDELNKTTGGLIRIEKEYILSVGESVQFLDHVLKYERIGGDEVNISYAGNHPLNADNPSPMEHALDANNSFFGRHNSKETSPSHPWITWYARKNGMLGNQIMVTVGKELQQGDLFYVDCVRYEIPAIEVLDWDRNLTNGVEKFKFITLRTQFPKGQGKKYDNETFSQWICKLPSCNATHVLPPFNMNHEIVDDTDVVLWQPLKLLHKWPYGDKDSGRPAVEYFPCAERYLTMQYPPYAWLKYFRAVPIDTDNDMDPKMPTDWQLWDNYGGPFYPGNVIEAVPNGWQCCKCGIPMALPECNGGGFTVFDNEHWIANDVDERIIDTDPLEFCWKSEDVEPRYSTNLVEILYETISGSVPLNPVVYVGGEYQQTFEPDKSEYPGSYLITTSFIAPNAKGDLNLNQTYNHTDLANRSRFAFTYNASDGTGIYMNENVTMPIAPVGDLFEIELYEGPNYVSMPVMPDPKDPIAIFGPEVNVWGYNTGTSDWETVSAVAEGTGYYAYAPKPKTVAVYGTGVLLPTWTDIENANPWTSGWNLVGPGNTSVDVPATGVQLLRYSRVHHDFLPVPPSDKLEPGTGYWAYKP